MVGDIMIKKPILKEMGLEDLIGYLNNHAKSSWEIRFHTKDGKQLFDVNYPDSPVTPDYEDYSNLFEALTEVVSDIY